MIHNDILFDDLTMVDLLAKSEYPESTQHYNDCVDNFNDCTNNEPYELLVPKSGNQNDYPSL
jgi:hypothetical protein